MSSASVLQNLIRKQGAIVPEVKEKLVSVQNSEGLVHPDSWTVVLYLEDNGEFRRVVENEHETLTAIVSEEGGLFTFTAGPTSSVASESAARGILFNRGSSVECLKSIAARFLVLMSRLRTSNKQTIPENQTDEGV